MKQEFEQFKSCVQQEPPEFLNQRILAGVASDLRTNRSVLLLKLILIHALVATLTLSFCPQFNVGPLGEGITSALYVLMRLHPLFCAAFCGSIFLGSSALVLVLVLKKSELAVLRERSWWIYSLLAGLSLSFFMLVGTPLQGHYGGSFLVTWILAALTSAWLITKVGSVLRLPAWRYSF